MTNPTTITLKKISGFNEACGKELEKRDYMDTVMRQIATKYNYCEISLPIIEDARAYAEEFVGNSPWPEWNEKGCFFFQITNYLDTYLEGNEQSVILIPEGTVSVTRWLANQLEQTPNLPFPVKLFYSLNCYRNELLSSLSTTKRREFRQFGLEILGSSSPQSDAEILSIIGVMLSELGIPIGNIRIRLNDIRIFEKLTRECGISAKHIVELKSLLDRIAEARVGKHAQTLQHNTNTVYEILQQYHLDEGTAACWKTIVEHKDYVLGGFVDCFDASYHPYFDLLLSYKEEVEKIGLNVCIDPCVIRSHEYYTGISFEIDVVTEACNYLEIAGGGRYDRLVGKFLAEKDGRTIPCTGFAFGIERVLELMNHLNCFDSEKSYTRNYNFGADCMDIVLPDASLSTYMCAFQNVVDFPANIKFKEDE